MGTTIDAVVSATGGLRSRHSALRLAVAAAHRTLERADVPAHDVDLVINAGLYRDRNLGEPALAPLIQKDAGINPEDPHGSLQGTFSFDVANGACGVMTGLQLADGFLRAGTVASALVVTSDADPGHGLAPGFPFAPAGGALLCRWRAGEHGFGPFHWLNATDGGESFRATVGLIGRHNVLVIGEDEAFAGQAGEVAAKAAHEAVSEGGLRPDEIGLVVASPARTGFVAALATGLGVAPEIIVTSGAELHTVALIAALELAVESGRLASAQTALFVSAGAGITAGAVLYRVGERA